MMAHAVFNFRGHNTLVHMDNGLGKTSVIDMVLAILGRDQDLISSTRRDKTAPLSSNRFSHIRIESVARTGSLAQEDMIGKLGADVPGEKHVFGFFGNSDTAAHFEFYIYRGTLEDCPVAYSDDSKNIYLIDNKTFKEQLTKTKDLKRSGSISKEDWRDEIAKHFEMADIDKMIAYQKTGAGDSIQSFYNVTLKRGESYGSAFFFAHLAPELLTDIMGEDGEPDEKYLEHTIFNSTIIVRKAQRKCEQEQVILEGLEKKLELVNNILDRKREMDAARAERDQALKNFEQGAQIIEEIIACNQIPGIPSIKLPKDEKVADIAAAMVLKDGQWYVLDKMLAEICDEEAKLINQRADRKLTKSAEAHRSELIEIPCNLKFDRDPRGQPNRIYEMDNATALLSVAPNIKQGWTKDAAISALKEAFKWAETADTNVFRREANNMKLEIEIADKKIESLNVTVALCDKSLKTLADESAKFADVQLAYKRMKDSPFFTPEELNMPSDTGRGTADELSKAKDNLAGHIRKVGEYQKPHEIWGKLKSLYGVDVEPAAIIDKLERDINSAKELWEGKRTILKALREGKDEAQKLLNGYNKNLSEIEKEFGFLDNLINSVDKYQNYFGSEDPSGLKNRVAHDIKKADDEISGLMGNIADWHKDLEALHTFRKNYGNNTDPYLWISEQVGKLYAFKEELASLNGKQGDLIRRRRELDTEQVSSGRVYSSALKIAGPDAVPLYKIAEDSSLSEKRRALVLTVFSSFLFAPTFDSPEAATECAKRFFEQGVEAPVFIRSELEIFFKEGVITNLSHAAHTYFLGIRTRPVDCLLNPSLLKEEKIALDRDISEVDGKIKAITKEIVRLDTESSEMQVARKAANALRGNLSQKYDTAEEQLSEKRIVLLSLQEKMQNSHLIDDVLLYNGKGGRKRYDSISGELLKLRTSISDIEGQLEQLAEQISAAEPAEDDAHKNYLSASEKSDLVADLKTARDFISYGGPDFMERAESTEQALKDQAEKADDRNRFDFEAAQKFIDSGGPVKAEQISTDIEKNTKNKVDAESEINETEKRRRKMQEHIVDVRDNSRRVDDYSQMFVRKYRSIARIRASLDGAVRVDITEDEILKRVRSEIRDIVGRSSNAGLVNQLGELVRELASINDERLSSAIDLANKELGNKTAAFYSEIDKVCMSKESGFSDVDRLWLKESKGQPETIQLTYDIWETDLIARSEAHQTSMRAVEQSRAELTQRLVSLISQLTNYYDILREIVKWRQRGDGSVEPGFQINAKIIGMEELPNLIERIVTAVETDEKRREEDREMGRSQSLEDVDIHKKIKEMFYREVFKNPEIRVFNQDLGNRSLPFDISFSTGQRMANTLLWMLKIADFAVEKNIRRESYSSAQRKKLRGKQERMFIIDGIFSNVSKKALLKETLSAIGRLKTKFQLIGFYHNPVAVYDENIFSVYLFGNQMRSPDNNAGFVFIREGKEVSPADIGMPEGQIEIADIHYDKSN